MSQIDLVLSHSDSILRLVLDEIMDVATSESANWSSTLANESSITDEDTMEERLLQLFAHLLWIDYLGYALLLCLTGFGSFINGILLWVLSSSPGPSSLVDLVQMHMAACDIIGAVVTTVLQCVTRVVLMYDVTEGLRLFRFFALFHCMTMSFEDISTILISIIRFKQVRNSLGFFSSQLFFSKLFYTKKTQCFYGFVYYSKTN